MYSSDAPGRGLLKVSGILYIIYAGIQVIASFILLSHGFGGFAFLLIIDVVWHLILGIMGVKHCDSLMKSKTLRALAIIDLVLTIIAVFGALFGTGSTLVALAILAVSISFLVGAQKNITELAISMATPRRSYPARTAAQTYVTVPPPETNTLIRRGFMSLEDSQWDKADDFFEQVLNKNPENAKAYVGKLCAQLHLNREEDLLSHKSPIDSFSNYKRAMQFADEKYRATLENYAFTPEEQEKKEQARIQRDFEEKDPVYQSVLGRLDETRARKNPEQCKSLVSDLRALGRYQNAEQILRELGAVTAKDYCPLCNASHQADRATCSQCGITFVK